MAGEDIKLTKLAKCAGCGAKVGAGVLAKLLDGIKVHHDPNLLVGFDKSCLLYTSPSPRDMDVSGMPAAA